MSITHHQSFLLTSIAPSQKAMIAKACFLALMVGLCQSQIRLECRDRDGDAEHFLKKAQTVLSLPADVSLTLDPANNNIKPNDVRVVTLSGLSEDQSNFMIQAQDQNGNVVGEFKERDGIELADCEGDDDTALNEEDATDRKTSFQLTWQAPASHPMPSGQNKTTFNFIYQIKGPRQLGNKQIPWNTEYKVVKSQDLDFYSGATSLASTALLTALTVAFAKFMW